MATALQLKRLRKKYRLGEFRPKTRRPKTRRTARNTGGATTNRETRSVNKTPGESKYYPSPESFGMLLAREGK